MDILFLDSSPSSHHERFVELFSTFGDVHSVFVDLLQEPPLLKFGLIVFADLDVTVDFATKFDAPKVGLSWAWDLQQTLRKDSLVKEKLKSALSVVEILIVDCLAVEEIAREFGLREDRIFRSPYGISIEDYPMRRHINLGTGKLRLYTNRRWETLYRPQILLEMAKELQLSETQFELILANDGSLREHLLREYSDLFEDGSCTWLGKISQEQNIHELEKADIYISVSSSDGSSLSLLEAMAIGTPSLVTDNPENREWIKENITGYLYSGNSGLDLALKIQSIALNPIIKLEQLKMSREKIIRDGNWTLIRKELVEKIGKMLSQYKPK